MNEIQELRNKIDVLEKKILSPFSSRLLENLPAGLVATNTPGTSGGVKDFDCNNEKTVIKAINPVNPTDLANKQYVDAAGGSGVRHATAVNYTTTVDDDIIGITALEPPAVTPVPRIITLGTATVQDGRVITIKDETLKCNSYTPIQIVTEGSQTIDGNADLFVFQPGFAATLYSDGSNWFTKTFVDQDQRIKTAHSFRSTLTGRHDILDLSRYLLTPGGEVLIQWDMTEWQPVLWQTTGASFNLWFNYRLVRNNFDLYSPSVLATGINGANGFFAVPSSSGFFFTDKTLGDNDDAQDYNPFGSGGVLDINIYSTNNFPPTRIHLEFLSRGNGTLGGVDIDGWFRMSNLLGIGT